LRVLVVEDEVLVAMLIEDMLADLGCIVVGSVSTLNAALDSMSAPAFDAAILDVNLNGAESYPVAHALAQKRVPFLFSTGYGEGGIPLTLRDVPVLAKPFERTALERALASLLT
jgi:CheY-like chemotaxis protein